MSLIPSSALSAALTPVQRSTNEHLRARKVQSEKDFHHAEEVEELNDTAVNSINDGQRGSQGGGGKDQSPDKPTPEEQVDIASLKDAPPKHAPRPSSKKDGPVRLDISA